MPFFISGKDMIEDAYRNQYSIGAFSAHNAETIQGILWAAEEENSPVMIQIGQKAIQYMGMEKMKKMIESFSTDITIPISIHLDHSQQYKQTLQAIQAGFQSVMFDGSDLCFDENVKITKKVAENASLLEIGVEGEIGTIGGTEDDITIAHEDVNITGVEEAVAFSKQTGIDYLAISMGTAHGIYKTPPNLRFEQLEKISNKVKKPIVLHGGSSVPDDQVQKAITLGVSKINVDTELRKSFTLGIQEVFQNQPDEWHLAVSLKNGRDKVKEKAIEKMRIFGSSQRAHHFKKA